MVLQVRTLKYIKGLCMSCVNKYWRLVKNLLNWGIRSQNISMVLHWQCMWSMYVFWSAGQTKWPSGIHWKLGAFMSGDEAVRTSPPMLSMWPCTGNLGWGTGVKSSESNRRLLWPWKNAQLSELWNSLINTVKSYLLTAPCFWLGR